MNRKKRWLRSALGGALLSMEILWSHGAEAQELRDLLPNFRGPDFLQSLGVGARSIGMGSAFSALADDASATFWNPGRLSVLRTRQVMIQLRSVPDSSTEERWDNTGYNNLVFSGEPQLTFAGVVWPLERRRQRFVPPPGEDPIGAKRPAPSISEPSKSAQNSPSQRRPAPSEPDTDYTDYRYSGHVGISLALGGYFHATERQLQRDVVTQYALDARSGMREKNVQGGTSVNDLDAHPVLIRPDGTVVERHTNQNTNAIEEIPVVFRPGNTPGKFRTEPVSAANPAEPGVPAIGQEQEILVRNQFATLAYGNRLGVRYARNRLGLLGYGVGLVYLDHSQSLRTFSTPGNRNQFTAKGSGWGYIAGASIGFGPDYRTYRLGVTYRGPMKIAFNSDIRNRASAFTNEIPSRFTFGLAYESKIRRDDIRLTAELQAFSSANWGTIDKDSNPVVIVSQADRRVAVANLHLGVEYVRNARANVAYPIRIGYRQNKGAAPNLSYDTDVVSLGFGLQTRDANNNQLINIEPTVEIITQTGTVFWTLTSLFRF